MRVGVLGLQHESNTFVSALTEIESFSRVHLLAGRGMAEAYADAHHEISGFFAGLAEAGIEAVPLAMAWAWPSGALSTACTSELMARVGESLALAGRLDGLLVAPHGAAVGESILDFDGHWLQFVRQHVGPAVPIVCTLDPHANVSPDMVAAVNAIFPYRTNPHLDQKECGQRAARLLARVLRKEVRPTVRAAFPPVAINIERQDTSRYPCRLLYELAEQMRELPGVLEVGVVLGFPYADVPKMGSSFVAVTDDRPDLAQSLADELAALLVSRRQDFLGQFVSIEEALLRAYQAEGPVCLLDMGDNVGGGAPGDGTWLLHAAYREGRADFFVCLFDPEAAEKACDRGQGHWMTLTMGGKADGRHGEPLTAQTFVQSLHDGKFTEREARHGGQVAYDMGPTAVVRTDRGQTVMLISRRIAPFSLQQLLSCGVEPRHFRVLTAKGVHAPVAAYAPVCRELIRVDTPGVTRADMRLLSYRHRRKPLFPFEDDELFDAPGR